MDAYSMSPLVADHLPQNHPVVTRDYSLFTPAISDMANTVSCSLRAAHLPVRSK